jgi:hypothetical protein
MDEAMRSLYEPPSALQGLRPGAVMTEAKRLARNAVKARWQAQGRKVPWVPHSELVEAGKDYLDAHQAELVSQAYANLHHWSGRLVPQLRTLAEREEREPRKIQR